MWPVSCRIPRCGRLTRDHCRRRNGLAAGDDRCAFVATTSIPISVEELALSLPKRSWRRIKWREGTAEPLSSRFARARVRVADRDYALTEGPPQEWLMIEWPEGEEKPAKYWLSTLPRNIAWTLPKMAAFSVVL